MNHSTPNHNHNHKKVFLQSIGTFIKAHPEVPIFLTAYLIGVATNIPKKKSKLRKIFESIID